MQWTSARKGSVAMQVWLGKQYLGQREKIEVLEFLESIKKILLSTTNFHKSYKPYLRMVGFFCKK